MKAKEILKKLAQSDYSIGRHDDYWYSDDLVALNGSDVDHAGGYSGLDKIIAEVTGLSEEEVKNLFQEGKLYARDGYIYDIGVGDYSLYAYLIGEREITDADFTAEYPVLSDDYKVEIDGDVWRVKWDTPAGEYYCKGEIEDNTERIRERLEDCIKWNHDVLVLGDAYELVEKVLSAVARELELAG